MGRSAGYAGALLTLLALPAAAQDARPDGGAIFTTVCATCHTVAPPPNAAPPMAHVAARYARAHADADAAVAAIVAYVRQPSADASQLPAHAIERFGLMPAQSQLTAEQLDAVARYVLTLADSSSMRGGRMGRHGPPGS